MLAIHNVSADNHLRSCEVCRKYVLLHQDFCKNTVYSSRNKSGPKIECEVTHTS